LLTVHLSIFISIINQLNAQSWLISEIKNKILLIFVCALGTLIIWLRFGQINSFTTPKRRFSKLFGLEEGYRVFLRAHVQIGCNYRRKFFWCENLNLGVYWSYSLVPCVTALLVRPVGQSCVCGGHRLCFTEHSWFSDVWLTVHRNSVWIRKTN
jgi:hypothetical protein